MIDPCIPIVARVTRFMSNRAWRAFLASHPGWHAPAVVGNCVRAGALLPLLALPGAAPVARPGVPPAAPGYPITEPAEGGFGIAQLPGSAPTAGLSQEVGAGGIGAAEVAGFAPVAIAAGGYPALYQVGGPAVPGYLPAVPVLTRLRLPAGARPELPGQPFSPSVITPAAVVTPPAPPVAVPEPASVAVLGAGLVVLGLIRRKRT